MKKLLIFTLASFLLTACGAAGGSGGGTTTSAPKMDVKTGAGKDTNFNFKSGAVYLSEMVSTAPGKPDVKTSAHTIYVANYELDAKYPGWVRKPLTADQIRVEFQLTGEAGTTKDSPFKVGTYSVEDSIANNMRYARITTFADGKETQTSIAGIGGTDKPSGEVKITSVTADTVSGEVNLTEGGKSITGTFTAKLPAAK